MLILGVLLRLWLGEGCLQGVVLNGCSCMFYRGKEFVLSSCMFIRELDCGVTICMVFRGKEFGDSSCMYIRELECGVTIRMVFRGYGVWGYQLHVHQGAGVWGV